jgi:hypothetical protein
VDSCGRVVQPRERGISADAAVLVESGYVQDRADGVVVEFLILPERILIFTRPSSEQRYDEGIDADALQQHVGESVLHRLDRIALVESTISSPPAACWDGASAGIVPPMTTRSQGVDVRRRAGWLPEDQDDLESWLAGHRERVEGRGEQVVLHPVLTEFQELMDTDPVVRMYMNQMIAQVPSKKPYRQRHLTSVEQTLRLINEVLTMAPEFGAAMVATALGAILDWTMGTRAGFAAYRDPRVNAMFILIEGDDPVIGLMAFVPVGMVEVSSCIIDAKMRPETSPAAAGQNGRSSAPASPAPPDSPAPTAAPGCSPEAGVAPFRSAPSPERAGGRPPSNSTWRARSVTASRLCSCWSVHSHQSSSASTTTREPLCRYSAQLRAWAPKTSTVK